MLIKMFSFVTGKTKFKMLLKRGTEEELNILCNHIMLSEMACLTHLILDSRFI